MAEEQSIFDFLQPAESQGGLKGALGSGIRGLSDFFQQATPALLQDEDVGFGGAFAAGLLGGLGTQSRQRDAVREQRRQEALKFLPTIYDQLTPDTQEQIAQTFLPGVTLRDQMSETEKKIFSDASAALRDPRVSAADRQAFGQIIIELDPDLTDATDAIIESIGMDATEDRRFSFINSLLSRFTPESVGRFEDSKFEDFGVLEERARGASGGTLSPSQMFNAQAFKDFLAIEQHKAEFGSTDREAADALDISGGRFSNVARATGMGTDRGGVLTKGDVFKQALSQVMQDMEIDLSIKLGDLPPDIVGKALNKANVLFDLYLQGYESQGIPVVGGEPSPRSPRALDIQEAEVKANRLQTAIDERIAAGDTRSMEEIAEELYRTGGFD